MVWERMERLLALLDLHMERNEHVPFDPRIHEAVAGEDMDGNGPVLVRDIIQPGFRTSAGVIRPAKVVVSKSNPSESAKTSGDPS